ncbi:SDR family NAD(P)-dependent oxidoreductase [Steroidobacter sp. S1-65]|uniref:SDR family NAD(P)-dependent oxidoreductase n=1 Tax=Steroidobacter gossypii TaxID=2805490 RepID=A0ABS1X6N6_9GAMM|nr:SDR family NAD(P)-dependent oxidoreductase [Steroidobacter gossypii]MBM0108892.1 SDR family NAD(P)-dependent oxidoreductase [Steroidobacter gossypii]
MNRKVFDPQSQQRFAELSRDRNPVHVDTVAARRIGSGSTIVHGIHSVLWLLESVVDGGVSVNGLGRLLVKFRSPILVGDEVTSEITCRLPNLIRARLWVDDTVALAVSMEFAGALDLDRAGGMHCAEVASSPSFSANDLNLEEMKGVCGALDFHEIVEGARGMFPAVSRSIGAERVAFLVTLSCVVGMIVPGLHSFFAGLDIRLRRAEGVSSNALSYAVRSVDRRFRLVHIDVVGHDMHGTLEALARMPPKNQPAMARIAARVRKDEFRRSIALVVGGSRGIGELTAKLICAGGGSVIITYSIGEADANRVADDIRRTGGRCDVLQYDVRKSAMEQWSTVDQALPDHIYYFATPMIARHRTTVFSRARLEEFDDFYLHGFADLVQICMTKHPSGMRVFYPSSTFVDTRPLHMTEYAMSKAAGEVLCTDLPRAFPGLEVVARRLPRLPTDQSNGLEESEMADPIEIMLPIVREMEHR